MRKRYRVLLSAAAVAALISPVGFALSPASTPAIAHVLYPVAAPIAAAIVTASVARPGAGAASSVPPEGVDAAGLLMVGTVLFGLAGVIRKAI